MIEDKKIISFWDEVHNKVDNNWLARSGPSKVLELYNLSPPKNKTIMDLGVGVGDMASYLYSLENNLVCVDISTKALEKITVPAKKLITKDISASPKVDMAIVHLVLQHCNDDMVLFLLNNIPLKKNGVIYAQSCGEEGLDISTDLSMLYFRSWEYLKKLIAKTNKKVLSRYKITGKKYSRSPAKKLYWDIFTLINS